MPKDTHSTPTDSSPDNISVKLFNSESGAWEHMQLRHRRDYIGGRGYVYSYQRVGSDKSMSAESFGKCQKLGLIKIIGEFEARVLWIGPQKQVA